MKECCHTCKDFKTKNLLDVIQDDKTMDNNNSIDTEKIKDIVVSFCEDLKAIVDRDDWCESYKSFVSNSDNT